MTFVDNNKGRCRSTRLKIISNDKIQGNFKTQLNQLLLHNHSQSFSSVANLTRQSPHPRVERNVPTNVMLRVLYNVCFKEKLTKISRMHYHAYDKIRIRYFKILNIKSAIIPPRTRMGITFSLNLVSGCVYASVCLLVYEQNSKRTDSPDGSQQSEA